MMYDFHVQNAITSFKKCVEARIMTIPGARGLLGGVPGAREIVFLSAASEGVPVAF